MAGQQEEPVRGLVRQLDPQALIEQAISKNASIEVLERLFALYKEIMAERAKQEFNLAMAEFQRNCPKIIRTEKADFQSKTGRVRYTYAPLEEVLDKILPVMAP